MIENLYMAHKNFHSKPCMLTLPAKHSAWRQALASLNYQKTFMPIKYKQPLPTHPLPKLQLYIVVLSLSPSLSLSRISLSLSLSLEREREREGGERGREREKTKQKTLFFSTSIYGNILHLTHIPAWAHITHIFIQLKYTLLWICKRWTSKQQNKTDQPKAGKYPTSHFSPLNCFVAWKRGLFPNICMLCFVIINSILFCFVIINSILFNLLGVLTHNSNVPTWAEIQCKTDVHVFSHSIPINRAGDAPSLQFPFNSFKAFRVLRHRA